ncbi:transglutaminase domain-containing protein [Microbacterium sp. CFBP 8790]|nr:transglutaminase domain-containing protein [Microbacterium sp. CFBP 8801]MBD8510307.1 transglutaminase domain-containing protein [Microbacterium sp. CFBP 8790]
MLPAFSVIAPGSWVAGAAGLSAAVLAAGLGVRLARLPALAASLVEVVVWVVLLTAMFGRPTALLGLIPTPATVASVPGLLDAAAEEIRVGVAPVSAATGLSFLLVAAFGALAIVLDHVVLTARMPLLAGVGLVAVSLIPTIAIPSDVDVWSFVVLAAALLFLLRIDTRARLQADPVARRPRTPRRVGASATALGVAAVAVIVAVVATPLLPQPGLRFASGGTGGVGTTINPNLELGNDLRQPRDVDVLSVRTTAPSAPYLRAVTLSSFDGSVWQPDSSDTVPVRDDAPVFDPLVVDGEIAVADWTTDIDVDQLDSPWLPVPYPASTVTGLQGDWLGMPQNRTVVSRSGSTRDQVYEVQSTVARPTLEQIRARPVGGGNLGDAVRTLPANVPAIIGDTAREVTAGTQNPYDALIALQTWFRSSEFRYSLDAPVDSGFDGAGLDAVADFLQVRAGYCVHYASAFAVMARTLDMPSRIVVGYLPGSATGTPSDGRTTFVVSSSQLHAWPEVYFEGIGWVPFEPTNSLGVPTNFASSSQNGASNAPATPQQDAATPGAQPSTAPSQDGRVDVGDQDGVGTGTGAGRGAAWVPAALAGLLVVLLAATPAVVRLVVRRRRLHAARAGDAVAAWTALREDAVDLGIPSPAAESPRAFAARLIADHGADADALDLLRAALEQVSYAGDAIDPSAGAGLADAVDRARVTLAAAASRPRRLGARLAPRSLLVRPGAASAEREPVGR